MTKKQEFWCSVISFAIVGGIMSCINRKNEIRARKAQEESMETVQEMLDRWREEENEKLRKKFSKDWKEPAE